MIDDVKIKKLKTHKDKRGFFCELIRQSDDIFKKSRFAQVSHSMTKRGVFKAWHLHKKQTDWICVLLGDVKLVLYDLRKNSKTYGKLIEVLMGEKHGKKVIKIPPGVAHGYKVINGPTHIIYIMDKEYNPDDELRISPSDPKISYDWKKT